MSAGPSLTLVSGLDTADTARRDPLPAGPVCARLDDERRQEIVRRSRLRHARHHSFAAVLAAAAADRVAAVTGAPPADSGVISVGGPHSASVNWGFVERAVSAGPNLVNPLSFPHTLISAVPTSVAALFGAHVCAVAVGHDQLAFFDVLDRSLQLVEAGLAQQILAPAVFDGGALTQEAFRRSARALPPADVALCGLFAGQAPDRPHLELLAVHPRQDDLDHLIQGGAGEQSTFWMRITEAGAAHGNFDSELTRRDVLTATAAVAIVEAARIVWLRPPERRTAPFVVAVEANGSCAGTTMRWCGGVPASQPPSVSAAGSGFGSSPK